MGKKINQLATLLANDTVQANDLLVVFDASANAAKKMTVQEFLTLVDAGLDIGALTVLTGASLDISNDYLVVRDASAGGENKKITPLEFFSRYSIQFLDDLVGPQVVQGQDYIGIYDGSANIYKRILVSEMQLALIPSTTYADDAAAATGGIAVGSLYVNTSTGAVHRRLV
jgi:hypothetical protein